MTPRLSRMTRRQFVKTTGVVAAASIASTLDPPAFAQPIAKRRYAIVGTGSRGCGMWGRELRARCGDLVDLVGLCDINEKRVEAARAYIDTDCPTFTGFDQMCDRVRPDLVVVTTVDSTHSEYIVKALERGLDVITEKPMATDEHQCRSILEAEQRASGKIVVGFNYRYAPIAQTVKATLASGEIGPITSVDFSWYLDVYHGADYFRRWHRLRSRSGTLLVHKATHHFDLVNWWLDADPVEVVAHGELKNYGERGPFRHTHCRPCPHKDRCQFYYDMTRNSFYMALYAACESVDGYHRDGCVFREDVDIYDTMAVLVRYSTGVTMTYSLNAFMPFEGYRIAFNGLKGRLEIRDYQRQPWTVADQTEIYLTSNFGARRRIEVPTAAGGHGGGDARLLDAIFRGATTPQLQVPDSRAGAMSILTGIAARTSIEQDRPVRVADLVRL